MLLLLSVVLILLLMGVLFYYQVALPLASAIFVLAWLALGMLTPVLWSLWLVVPLAIVLVVLSLPPIRGPPLSSLAVRALCAVAPPMRRPEVGVGAGGSTWWEKPPSSGRPDWRVFAGMTLAQLSAEDCCFLDNDGTELCATTDE